MSGRLDGKVALVTGASSGIGRAAALSFAKEGAAVVAASRRVLETEETAQRIKAAGGEAYVVKTDVSVEAEVENMVEKTIEKYGRLDIAFNNAGLGGREGQIHLAEQDYWDVVMDTNLKGVWLCMKYELPRMLQQGGGSIVNMSSTAGLIGWTGGPIYTASKWGVIGLTKSAALQYASAGIRVNAICPAFTRTEKHESSSPEAMAKMTSTIPQGRIGTVDEVAEAAVWLASGASSFCVGVCLTLDGGQTSGVW